MQTAIHADLAGATRPRHTVRRFKLWNNRWFEDEMKLTEYAKLRKLPIGAVRQAARTNNFPSHHHNSALTDEQQVILDSWFTNADAGGTARTHAESTTSLPDYFTVDLPLCLLGKRTVHVTRGETISDRKIAAFETYKQAGGILGSRFVPTITPIEDSSQLERSDIFEQEPV